MYIDNNKFSLSTIPSPGFERKPRKSAFALAITANFVNKKTRKDVLIQECGGKTSFYDQEFFKHLEEESGVKLENIVYFMDETHYLVFVPKKEGLLKIGVLKEVSHE